MVFTSIYIYSDDYNSMVTLSKDCPDGKYQIITGESIQLKMHSNNMLYGISIF